MFDPKEVKLGIAPIGWCNDDAARTYICEHTGL